MKTSLDESRRTAYELIASHGDVENLIFLAMLMKGLSLELLHVFQGNSYVSDFYTSNY
jgi:hypothetical protein